MGKNTGKLREFCQSGKVGTIKMILLYVNSLLVSEEFIILHLPSETYIAGSTVNG